VKEKNKDMDTKIRDLKDKYKIKLQKQRDGYEEKLSNELSKQ
jgi:hypothetical protein